MTDEKIVNLVPVTDGAVRAVLMKALKQDLQEVIVIGWCSNEDENLYIGASTQDIPALVWLLKHCDLEVSSWIREGVDFD